MSYNVKNYTEQGGEVTHIGGELVIEEGASVEGFPSADSSVVVLEVEKGGYQCGQTFKELWDLYNQNKIIFIFKKESAESSVPDETDYKTKLFTVIRMEFESGTNYRLVLQTCNDEYQVTISTCTGQADTQPGIH